MQANLIAIESMVGVSKKTGNEYAIYTIRGLVAMTPSDQLRKTPDYTRMKSGYNLLELQVNELLYSKVVKMEQTERFPMAVELSLVQNISSNGQLINECVDVELAKSSSVKAAS